MAVVHMEMANEKKYFYKIERRLKKKVQYYVVGIEKSENRPTLAYITRQVVIK